MVVFHQFIAMAAVGHRTTLFVVDTEGPSEPPTILGLGCPYVPGRSSKPECTVELFLFVFPVFSRRRASQAEEFMLVILAVEAEAKRRAPARTRARSASPTGRRRVSEGTLFLLPHVVSLEVPFSVAQCCLFESTFFLLPHLVSRCMSRS